MKIALIGGTGLTGPHLIYALQQAGHECICLNRRGMNPCGGQAFSVDRNDSLTLGPILEELNPEVVLDNIPFTQKAAEELVEIIKPIGCRLVATSSIDVYQAYNLLHKTITGPYQTCPLKENDELRDRLSFQGEDYDKLNVESVFFEEIEDVTIFRLPAIYGAPDFSRIKGYAEPMLKGEESVAIHPQFADWKFSYASGINCAHAISLGVDQTGQQAYNVAEIEPYSQKMWCERIADIIGWSGEIVMDDQQEVAYEADCNQHFYVSTDKIRTELGFSEIVTRDEVLRDNIDHLTEIMAQDE